MCDEHMSLCTHKQVRARKEHRCCECNAHITVGTLHWVTTGLYDARWDTYRTCNWCQAAWGCALRSGADCQLFGGLDEEIHYGGAAAHYARLLG